MKLTVCLLIVLAIAVQGVSVQKLRRKVGRKGSMTNKAFVFAGFEEKTHMGTLKTQVLEKGKQIKLPAKIQKLDWLSVMDQNSPLRQDGFREWLPSKRGMLFRRRTAVDSDKFDFVECKTSSSEKVLQTNPKDESDDRSVPVAVTHFSCMDLMETDIAKASLLETKKRKKGDGDKKGDDKGKAGGVPIMEPGPVVYPYVANDVWTVPEFYNDYIPSSYWHDIQDYYVDGERYYYPYGWSADVWGNWRWRYFGVSPDGYYACNTIKNGACTDAVTYFPYYYDYYWDSPEYYYDHFQWA